MGCLRVPHLTLFDHAQCRQASKPRRAARGARQAAGGPRAIRRTHPSRAMQPYVCAGHDTGAPACNQGRITECIPPEINAQGCDRPIVTVVMEEDTFLECHRHQHVHDLGCRPGAPAASPRTQSHAPHRRRRSHHLCHFPPPSNPDLHGDNKQRDVDRP
jgi:hypothetical protein